MTIKLIKLKDETNPYDNYDVELIADIVDRTEMLELFEVFLLSCGFTLNGVTLELVEEELIKDDEL